MSALDFCTQSATTWRSPAPVGGKIGAMAAYLEIQVLPLMPVRPEIAATVALSSPREAKETYCPDADVVEGDQLEVGGTRYIIRGVAEWPWADADENFLHLVIEEVR